MEECLESRDVKKKHPSLDRQLDREELEIKRSCIVLRIEVRWWVTFYIVMCLEYCGCLQVSWNALGCLSDCDEVFVCCIGYLVLKKSLRSGFGGSSSLHYLDNLAERSIILFIVL